MSGRMSAEQRRAMLMNNPRMYPPDQTTLEQNSLRFGALPNVPVGTTFDSRAQCVKAGVHTRSFAGISGNLTQGACSIVMSGGRYADDDHGETFTYIGTGGQQNSFAGHTEEVADQTFDHADNAALRLSVETRRPVRVIRGAGASKYAPLEGYRYDGLYIVERAYMGKSPKNFDQCRFFLRRCPGQDPVPGWD